MKEEVWMSISCKTKKLCLVMFLLMLVFSCGALADDKPIKLVFGDVYAVGQAYTKADQYFKELVQKNSHGKLVIDYFPAGQLGSEREMLEATKAGAQHITQTTTGMFGTLYPKIGTLELPYLFRDRNHYYKSVDVGLSLMGEDLAKVSGLKILFWRERAPRELTTKKPVRNLDDIKGLKIRVSEVPVRVALWRALGTSPSPLPMGDVYTSLATGAIDAQENPLDTIYGFKLYEQQKYVILTDHMREICLIAINKKTWDRLSPKYQKVLLKSGRESAVYSNRLVQNEEKKCRKLLEKQGMKFLTIDKRPFIKKAKAIWNRFGDEDIYQKIEAVK
jgi:tripartite ATP-independent transporter DctP family solute receptor